MTYKFKKATSPATLLACLISSRRTEEPYVTPCSAANLERSGKFVRQQGLVRHLAHSSPLRIYSNPQLALFQGYLVFARVGK